jgi:hypothetical protein
MSPLLKRSLYDALRCQQPLGKCATKHSSTNDRAKYKGTARHSVSLGFYVLFKQLFFLALVRFTVARWPNFRLNNSKQTSKNISWREKLVYGKWPILSITGRKKRRKFFQINYTGRFLCYAVFLCIFINNYRKYLNQEQFLPNYLNYIGAQ